MLINKGFLNDTKEFLQYIAYKNIRGNFARIAQACKCNEDLKREIAAQTVKPVVEKVKDIEDHISQQKADDAAIREMFADYGTSPKEVVYVQEGMVMNEEGYMVVTEDMMAELPFD